MGTARALVPGAGSWPACTCSVSKRSLRFVGMAIGGWSFRGRRGPASCIAEASPVKRMNGRTVVLTDGRTWSAPPAGDLATVAFPREDDPLHASKARTVPALFLERVGKTPDAEAFRWRCKREWPSLSWRETEARVRAIACGLRSLGLAGEERCAILSGTRLEWILADYGILCAGGATTTIYPSSTPEECAFILADSESAYAFVEDEGQLAKLAARRAELPALRKVVVLEGHPRGD